MAEDRFAQIQRLRQQHEDKQRAVWQDRVRGYVVMMQADLGQLRPSPPRAEVVQHMITVFAEQISDRDLMSVIGPFARELPDAYRDRWRTRERVQRFRETRERIRAGHLPPIPGGDAQTQIEETAMTEPKNNPEPSAEEQALRASIVQRHALQRSVALNKAKWQAELRLRFAAFMHEMNQSNHPLEEVELVQFLLQLAADEVEDFDLLGLILPLAERLPQELKRLHEESAVASEFLRVGHLARTYGPNGKPAGQG